MKNLKWFPIFGGAAAILILAASYGVSAETAVTIPAPAMDAPASTAASEKVVLAGGCFWGVQGVFQHLKGVKSAISGYAGGTKVDPSYEQVSGGWTGHAESVEITFDPREVSFGKILQVYFSVATNLTESHSLRRELIILTRAVDGFGIGSLLHLFDVCVAR